MRLIREPKNIDFVVNSEPWTDEELVEFRLIMRKKRGQFHKKKTRSFATTI
jgi:hypothetical protein